MVEKSKATPLSGKLNRDVFFGTSPDLPRIIEVDLVKLRPNPDQPRSEITKESVQELAASIDQHGLIQPIAVAQDPDNREGFIVVAGERRFRAFEQLDRDTIPAIMTTGAPDEIALIENIQRENLHPLDEARALANLMQRHHYSQGDVAGVVGKSRTSINELLRLNTLPQHIQEGCRTSDTPKSILVELSKIADDEQQRAVWEKIKSGGMTVLAARATKKGTPSKRPRRKLKPAEQALDAGNTFVLQLRKVSSDELTADPGLFRQLHLLSDQVHGLLRQLTESSDAKNERT